MGKRGGGGNKTGNKNIWEKNKAAGRPDDRPSLEELTNKPAPPNNKLVTKPYVGLSTKHDATHCYFMVGLPGPILDLDNPTAHEDWTKGFVMGKVLYQKARQLAESSAARPLCHLTNLNLPASKTLQKLVEGSELYDYVLNVTLPAEFPNDTKEERKAKMDQLAMQRWVVRKEGEQHLLPPLPKAQGRLTELPHDQYCAESNCFLQTFSNGAVAADWYMQKVGYPKISDFCKKNGFGIPSTDTTCGQIVRNKAICGKTNTFIIVRDSGQKCPPFTNLVSHGKSICMSMPNGEWWVYDTVQHLEETLVEAGEIFVAAHSITGHLYQGSKYYQKTLIEATPGPPPGSKIRKIDRSTNNTPEYLAAMLEFYGSKERYQEYIAKCVEIRAKRVKITKKAAEEKRKRLEKLESSEESVVSTSISAQELGDASSHASGNDTSNEDEDESSSSPAPVAKKPAPKNTPNDYDSNGDDSNDYDSDGDDSNDYDSNDYDSDGDDHESFDVQPPTNPRRNPPRTRRVPDRYEYNSNYDDSSSDDEE